MEPVYCFQYIRSKCKVTGMVVEKQEENQSYQMKCIYKYRKYRI